MIQLSFLTFSVSSVIMTVITTNVLILLICLAFRSDRFLLNLGYPVILFFLILTGIRMALPFELPVTTNIYWPDSISNFIAFLRNPASGLPVTPGMMVFFIWMAGFVVFLVKSLRQIRRFQMLVDSFGRNLSEDSEYMELFQEICRERNVTSRLQLIACPGIPSPMLFSGKRSYILLPEEMIYSGDDLRCICTHEVMHYKNHDPQIKFLFLLLRCIYWWNPLSWILFQRVETMLEVRVDQKILQRLSTEEAVSYLLCLKRTAEQSISRRECPDVGLSFAREHASLFAQRLVFIGDTITPVRKHSAVRVLSVGVVILLYLLSVFFILEGSCYDEEDLEGTWEINPATDYFVRKSDGTYDLYCNGQYFMSFPDWDASFEGVPIREGNTESEESNP